MRRWNICKGRRKLHNDNNSIIIAVFSINNIAQLVVQVLDYVIMGAGEENRGSRNMVWKSKLHM
jgi:hypothetical protein